MALIPLVDVRCGHCRARGQMALPPPDLVPVGPCPACGELNMFVFGATLPLSREYLEVATYRERMEYLRGQLAPLVEERLRAVADRFGTETEEALTEVTDPARHREVEERNARAFPKEGWKPRARISDAEMAWFKDVQLGLLDSAGYAQVFFPVARPEPPVEADAPKPEKKRAPRKKKPKDAPPEG
jgi:hypothetical protein